MLCFDRIVRNLAHSRLSQSEAEAFIKAFDEYRTYVWKYDSLFVLNQIGHHMPNDHHGKSLSGIGLFNGSDVG